MPTHIIDEYLKEAFMNAIKITYGCSKITIHETLFEFILNIKIIANNHTDIAANVVAKAKPT